MSRTARSLASPAVEALAVAQNRLLSPERMQNLGPRNVQIFVARTVQLAAHDVLLLTRKIETMSCLSSYSSSSSAPRIKECRFSIDTRMWTTVQMMVGIHAVDDGHAVPPPSLANFPSTGYDSLGQC